MQQHYVTKLAQERPSTVLNTRIRVLMPYFIKNFICLEYYFSWPMGSFRDIFCLPIRSSLALAQLFSFDS